MAVTNYPTANELIVDHFRGGNQQSVKVEGDDDFEDHSQNEFDLVVDQNPPEIELNVCLNDEDPENALAQSLKDIIANGRGTNIIEV
jgi:hypothetical protein